MLLSRNTLTSRAKEYPKQQKRKFKKEEKNVLKKNLETDLNVGRDITTSACKGITL